MCHHCSFLMHASAVDTHGWPHTTFPASPRSVLLRGPERPTHPLFRAVGIRGGIGKCWHPAPVLCHYYYLRGFPCVNKDSYLAPGQVALHITSSEGGSFPLHSLQRASWSIFSVEDLGAINLLVRCELSNGIHLAPPGSHTPLSCLRAL